MSKKVKKQDIKKATVKEDSEKQLNARQKRSKRNGQIAMIATVVMLITTIVSSVWSLF